MFCESVILLVMIIPDQMKFHFHVLIMTCVNNDSMTCVVFCYQYVSVYTDEPFVQ